MALTVDGIFSLMPELFLPEKAAGLNASVSYKVTGEGGGDYTCVIQDGAFSLVREIRSGATASVEISAEDWIALNEGRLDAMQAFMTGKLKGGGDLGLLQKFPRFFRKPEAKKGPGKPLAELLKERLPLLKEPIRITLGGQDFGEGPRLSGEEGPLRGLVSGLGDPGPALLGGTLRFAGDMSVLRSAWKAWSAQPAIGFPDTPGGKALATLVRRYRGGAAGSLELKVEGQSYTLAFSEQGLSIRPGESDGGATLVIGDGDFAALNQGKLNLVSALLEGRISVKGDFSRVASYTAHFEAAVNPAQALLESMPERFNPEKAGDLEACVGYELGEVAYTLWVREGKAMVFPRLLSPCDTTLKASPEDFVGLNTGTLNAQEAFMSGKIRIEGDPLLMQKVSKCFRRA
ncbi:MAG: SCP2 sterol-binding domain-containing protein [Acidobacteria bacterium]|nr:SCP2 sterol-binding domain-containing protein [Acidobacteriota bacterium]